jgi:hypothetical protein
MSRGEALRVIADEAETAPRAEQTVAAVAEVRRE